MATPNPLDAIISLAKRRGFVYQAGEIYGGSRSAWDYGPLGTALKENIKREWWKFMVQSRDDIVGIDSSVILPRQVWEASGHVEVFSDPLVESLHTHKRFRADHLLEAYEAKHGRPPANGLADINEPDTGQPGAWTEPRNFSGLLKTFLGPVDDEEGMAYLRPETAQGIFVNFANVLSIGAHEAAVRHRAGRQELPQRDHARKLHLPHPRVRADGDGVLRRARHRRGPGSSTGSTRARPGTSTSASRPENLRRFEHPKEKLSHYSKKTVDLEYQFRFAGNEWGELMGVANRTDFDLKTHSEKSGVDLSYFDQTKNERWIPYVIEPAFGLTRALMAFLVDAYAEDEAPNTKGGVDKRTVLRLDRRLAPVKVAVLPLSRNEQLSPVAKELADELRKHWMIEFDDAGAIGRRYRRQDEIGTPFAVTVDFETLDDKAVTVRERDTMSQERVPLDKLVGYLAERLLGA